ncbi:hypothetical protein C0Z18_10775 [Trinickia dabaoshanensis]|uniref:Uncharacterized protein n=1 Tax=Trinickia dabaoshanensis TaxID=564714 RepID=A0A2N7VTE3_9BURK|nr:hypothetical protein [Trinickia dabaoshanensis]PMS20414.1 hypothetical protein C0Z18_10775 [Trinickia dabaoshanensis]
MNGAMLDAVAGGGASWKAYALDSPYAPGPGSFAEAMAAVPFTNRLAPGFAAAPVRQPSDPGGSAIGALARHLDGVGRQRMEAGMLSERLAGAWASDIDAPTLAVSMHRQARAMASYNMNVMWGAKLVGVTAGALRQLVSAT